MGAFNLLINGRLVPGDMEMPILNPATEEVLSPCPRASRRRIIVGNNATARRARVHWPQGWRV